MCEKCSALVGMHAEPLLFAAVVTKARKYGVEGELAQQGRRGVQLEERSLL